MFRADNTGIDIKPVEKSAMIRLILWFVWLSSGIILLLLMAEIVATLIEKPLYSTSDIEQRMDSFESNPHVFIGDTKNENNADNGVQDIIKQINNRKGYSNPTRSVEDEEEEPEEVTTRRARPRRPLKPIGPDFNPNKSFVIRHANGTLTYVFPTNYTTTISPNKRLYPTDSPITTPTKSEYPVDLINVILISNRASFEGAFGDDFVISDGDALNTRSDTPDEPFLCESNERLFHPLEGRTRNNFTVWIVNTKDYKQGVRIETCRYVGKPCKFCEFDTACKQIYHYRTLVAVDTKTKELYKEQILLPSSCKCAKLLS